MILLKKIFVCTNGYIFARPWKRGDKGWNILTTQAFFFVHCSNNNMKVWEILRTAILESNE